MNGITVKDGIFINGFNFGRFRTYGDEENVLFVPARFIKNGENRVIVFDVFANDEMQKRVVFDAGQE